MQVADYTLHSGAALHLSSAAWEQVVALWSAVKSATIGQKLNPEAGDLIMTSPVVKAAVWDLFPWATYDGVKIYPGLFDEVKLGDKARGDYLEICEKLIEFQLRPFFLMSSSSSTASKEKHTASPALP